MNLKPIFVIPIVILLLFSCKSDKKSTDQKQKLFTYSQVAPATSLDPAFAKNMANIWPVNQIFNGLVQLDDNLNVKPAIAKSWQISEDGKTYTFKLRDDVFFHDSEAFPQGKGRKVTAEDVKYSLNRILDPTVSSPGLWIFKDRLAAAPFTVKDPNTFVLKLAKPFRPMLGILTMQYCSVVPKEAITKYKKEFDRNPVGTGPFTFVNWVDNQAILLKKNPNYFEKDGTQQLPYMDGIRINFLGDRNTSYLEFMKGKQQMLSGLEASIVNELLTADGELLEKHKDKINFQKSPFLNMEYLGINLDFKGDTPLKNKKVRQALNYGIDRAKMMRSLRNNVGKPATAGFIPVGLPSHSPDKVKGYTYNPEKARRLLAEAGFPNGKGMPKIQLLTNPNYKDISTYLTKQWKEIGVDVEIDVKQSGVAREMVVKGNAPFFRASWIADYPDGENFLTLFYGKNPTPPNYTRFNNVKYNELYELALAENNDQKRYALYHQMEQLIIDEAPVIFLFYDETARFSQKSISGYSNNAINLLSVKRLKID